MFCQFGIFSPFELLNDRAKEYQCELKRLTKIRQQRAEDVKQLDDEIAQLQSVLGDYAYLIPLVARSPFINLTAQEFSENKKEFKFT